MVSVAPEPAPKRWESQHTTSDSRRSLSRLPVLVHMVAIHPIHMSHSRNFSGLKVQITHQQWLKHVGFIIL